jgi:hypothetical protein
MTNKDTTISFPFLTEPYRKKYKAKDLTLINNKGSPTKK